MTRTMFRFEVREHADGHDSVVGRVEALDRTWAREQANTVAAWYRERQPARTYTVHRVASFDVYRRQSTRAKATLARRLNEVEEG